MGGGVKSTPPGWLLYANPWGMPRMDWFFMTLFLSILERSWVGHFWDFFLKFPKNFTSTIFSIYNPKGGPFYTCKNAFRIGSFLGSKIELIDLLRPKLGAKIIHFFQNLHFHWVWFVLIDFNRGDRFHPPHVVTHFQKPM